MTKTADLAPHSLDAERCVLGSILLDSGSIVKVCDFLKPADFHEEQAAKVYKAMLDIFQRGEAIDYISLTNEMARHSGLEEGLSSYAISLVNWTPTASHIVHHAREVQRLAICRRGIRLAGEIAQRFHERPENVAATAGELATKLLEMGDRLERRNPDPDDILMRTMGLDHARGIKLTSPRLNYLTGGLVPSELWVIGAFSSTGKTAFALQLMKEALEHRKRCAYFSLEMSQEQLMLRLLANVSGVPMGKIVNPASLTVNEQTWLSDAEGFLGGLTGSCWIYDDVYDVSEMCYLARKHQIQAGLNVIFVDYIQNITGQGERRVDAISSAINTLLRLAKQLDCCVVVLSQISNAEAKDRMGDNDAYTFKDAGAIRDTADKAWMLTRDREREKNLAKGLLHANLKKNRQGRLDSINFEFEFATGRIVEVGTARHEDSDGSHLQPADLPEHG